MTERLAHWDDDLITAVCSAAAPEFEDGPYTLWLTSQQVFRIIAAAGPGSAGYGRTPAGSVHGNAGMLIAEFEHWRRGLERRAGSIERIGLLPGPVRQAVVAAQVAGGVGRLPLGTARLHPARD